MSHQLKNFLPSRLQTPGALGLQITHRSIIFSSALLAFSLASCSGPGKDALSPSQLDTEIRSAAQTSVDIDASRQSEAMQKFLIAQLALGAEDFDTAFENLRESQALIATRDPEIQLTLAELYVRRGELEAALDEVTMVGPQELRALALKAAILDVLGRKEEAAQAYQHTLEIEPAASEARLMLARAALEREANADATVLLEGIFAKDARNIPAKKLLARAYRALGNSGRAEELLKEVRQLDSLDQDTFKLFLMIALERGDLAGIEEELQREQKINPENSLPETVRALDLKDESQRLGFMRNLESEVGKVPSSKALRLELARFALVRRDLPQAIMQFSLLLALDQSNDEARYTLALAFSSAGRTGDALRELHKIDSDSEWYVRAKAFSGLIYRQRSNYEEAEKCFRDALEKEPEGGGELQSYLASVLREAKKYKEAQVVFENMLSNDPQDERVLFNYGVLLHDMKSIKEAQEVMSRLIALNPQHAEAMNFVAYLLAEDHRDLERALELITRAIQLQPENGFYIDTRGWIYYKMGRFDEAVKDLEKASLLTKNDPEIIEHLADVYAIEGHKIEALQRYSSALDRFVDGKDEDDAISAERVRRKIADLKGGTGEKK